MAGLPWDKFYWEKWASEPTLKLVGFAAKGLWMDLLCLMAKEGGQLKINGKRPSVEAIARVVGHTAAEILPLLKELEEAGVFGRTQGNVIICRRMFRGQKSEDSARDRREKTRDIDRSPGLFSDLAPALEEEVDGEGIPPHPQGGSEVDQAVALWNALAEVHDLPRAIELNEDRRKKIRARIREAGLEGWRAALEAVRVSAHCLGKNDRKWKANIDFVAQPSSFTKLREGYYGRDAKHVRLVAAAEHDPWPDRARRWRLNRYWDEIDWGPKPGRPGCQCPADLLDPPEEPPGEAKA